MSLLFLLADAADDAHGAEGQATFPPFDTWHFPSQLFWLIFTFGALYLILSRSILPKLSANIERRSDTIASDLDEAARLNEQAEKAQQSLEMNLAKARAGARAKAAEAEAEVSAEIAEETQRVDQEIDAKLVAAEARIADLRATALANVETIASEATTDILSRFGVSVSPKDAQSAVKTALGGK